MGGRALEFQKGSKVNLLLALIHREAAKARGLGGGAGAEVLSTLPLGRRTGKGLG